MNQAWHPGAAQQLPSKLGPFTVLSVLGEGGSGVVYAARWGHREVALKVLRAQVAATEGDRERFIAEARLLAEIEHPSVVKVLNVGALPDGRPYLAMEKLEGETLAHRLGRGSLYMGEALALFAQLCDAVDALHARGLIHRDLKPENVFLTGGGRYAVLLDFGIAKELHAPASTVTQDGGVRGTPAYMAPERFFGQPAGMRSDIYELGVVLYAMLVGRLPWRDVADPEARLNPARPSAQGVALPAQLEAELLRALSTRPEARPESASAFLGRIDQALRAGGAAPVRRTADLGGPREVAQLQAAQAQMVAPPQAVPQPIAHPGSQPVAYPVSQPMPQLPPMPTAPATPSALRVRAPRWPWLILAIGIAALAAIIIIAVATKDPEPGPSKQTSLPPWSDESAPAEPTAAEGAPAETELGVPLTANARLAAAITSAAPPPAATPGGATDAGRYFPADEALVFVVRVRELLDSAAFGPALRSLKDNPDVASMLLFSRMCKLDPFADLDWAAIGLPAGDSPDLDVVLAGRLDRKAIGTCADQLTDGGEVVWIDERTLFFTTRTDVGKAWLAARAAGTKSFAAASADLLARADRGATLWIAGDPQSALGPAEAGGLPPPRQIFGGARLGRDLAIDAWLRYTSADEAARAVTMATEELDGIGAILGDPKFDRRGAEVHLTAHVDPIITAILGQAIESAAAE